MTQLLPMGQNRVRNQFFWLFSKFGSLVCLTNSRGKIHWLQNYGFCHFLKVPLLVFLDIAQNCSLGHCLTARRAETSKKKKKKKKKKTQIGLEKIFSILMLSSVHSNLLVFIHTRQTIILSTGLSKILFRIVFIFHQFQLTVMVSNKKSGR